ncbi:MAG: HAD-IC family P-type ATPase, partial [Oscillospiraceae bacterium]|nr:HAD-IC family P-type ATPase [Oscillospiraceae bacterium]
MNLFHRGTRNKQIQKNKSDSEAKLRACAFDGVDALYEALSVMPQGLTGEQAEERQDEYGRNVITSGTNNSVLHRLREAVINPFNVVLLIIAVISLFTDVISSSRPDWLTVGIILALVLLSSGVAFFQSQRSNAAAESLSKMISNKADVWRDGKLTEIAMDEVVPGDIVKLSAGDMIPADVRFLTTKDTFIAQAALTGESNPVEKFSDIKNERGDALTDLQNIGFMGSNVVSGSATAIALATGNDTYFGAMAK